jgi:CHAT domain-containing protein
VGRFVLDWYAGSAAQLELYSPETAKQSYRLKYTSSLRRTIRPPLENLKLGPGQLGPLDLNLTNVVTGVDGSRGVAGLATDTASKDARDALQMAGRQLFDLFVPRYIQADLRRDKVFLEIGIDERLVDYPWELMHDGESFLCLRQYVGRFVNASGGIVPPGPTEAAATETKLDALAMLVISVPNPQPRGKTVMARLDHAVAETKAIYDVLTGVDGVTVTVLRDKDATFNNVYTHLQQQFQIIHFTGHATFNPKDQRLSSLMLYDRDMPTGPIAGFFNKAAPILCFVNACESGKASAWNSRYNLFGLARAFLDTGSYLLGSRWMLADQPAAAFATTFYSALIKDGKPLGQALLEARADSRQASPNDLAWASYVYYGDPRVCFRRQ